MSSTDASGGKVTQMLVEPNRDRALADLDLEGWAVSQANVEVVRCVVEALNTRDLEGYLACCTEDVELHTPLEVLVGVHAGPGGIRRWFADIEDAAPDFHLDLRRVEAISGNQVLAFVHTASTGRVSGIPMPMELTIVYDFIDGKISRIRIFLDHSEALKAVDSEE